MNNSFRKKLLGGRPRSNSKLEKKGKAIEKVLVKRKNTVFGGDLPSKPPKFLMQALLLVQQHGAEIQGIFRQSANKTTEDSVVEQIENDPNVDLEQLVKNDAILASSLIKRYFRSLEDPLLVGALYHTIIAAATSTEESESDTSREMVKTILQKRLPPQNYNMLKIICEFLKNKIVTKSGANFMTPENLAIVFQPNILYLPGQNLMDSYKETPTACHIIKQLIESPEFFFDKEASEIAEPTAPLTPIETDVQSEDSANTNSEDIPPTTPRSQETSNVSPVEKKSMFSLNLGGLSKKSSFVRQKSQPNGFFNNPLPSPRGSKKKPVLRKISNIVYDGSMNERGEKHGFGKFMLPDGKFYLGEFQNDQFHGHGTLIDVDGTKYEGDWDRGVRDGKGQMWTVHKGKPIHYEGQWHENQYSGEGKMSFSDGSVYEGHWYKGMRHGYGTLTYSDRRGMYEGNWFNNKKNGFGILVEGDVTNYKGEWKDNKYHGKGTLEQKDLGERYEGNFDSGEYNGMGTLITGNGRMSFSGSFLNGQPWNGSGSILIDEKTSYGGVWSNGSFDGTAKVGFTDGRYYEGDMVQYRYEGFGVMHNGDGTKYSGQFTRGKRHGEGTLTGPICTYIGHFEDGLFNGEGKIVDSESKAKLFEGEFKDDQPWNGKGVIYGATRQLHFTGEFFDGVFTGYGVQKIDEESPEFKHYSKSGTYDGNFVNTKYQGQGSVHYTDGSCYEGKYEDDLRHGEGIWSCAGKSFDRVYEKGVLVKEKERLADVGVERKLLFERWNSIQGLSMLMDDVNPEDIDPKLLRVLKKLTDLAQAK